MVFDILHKVKIRKKSTSPNFKKNWIGRQSLKSYAKSDIKTGHWKRIVTEIKYFKIQGLCRKNRPFKDIAHSLSVQCFKLNFALENLNLE